MTMAELFGVASCTNTVEKGPDLSDTLHNHQSSDRHLSVFYDPFIPKASLEVNKNIQK